MISFDEIFCQNLTKVQKKLKEIILSFDEIFETLKILTKILKQPDFKVCNATFQCTEDPEDDDKQDFSQSQYTIIPTDIVLEVSGES